MRSRRHFIKVAVSGVIATAASLTVAWAQAQYPAKIAHLELEVQPRHQGLEMVAELVKERTNGEVEFSIFPAGQLGNARQLAEGVQFGTIECTVSPVAFVAGFNPVVSVFDIPFLMPDEREKFDELRTGEFAQYVLDSFEPRGFEALMFWRNSRKQMTSNEPIGPVEQFEGQKFRVMDSRVLIDQFSGLGANAIVMQFGELYTGLQTGVIDGQENPLETIAAMKFHEVQDYMVLSSHGVLLDVVLCNPNWWNSLPEEHREVITEAFAEVRPKVDDMVEESAAKALEQIRESGSTEVRELSEEEREKWRARMVPPAREAYLATAGEEGKRALELYGEEAERLGLPN